MKHFKKVLVTIALTLSISATATAACPLFKIIKGHFTFTPDIICVNVYMPGYNLCVYNCGS